MKLTHSKKFLVSWPGRPGEAGARGQSPRMTGRSHLRTPLKFCVILSFSLTGVVGCSNINKKPEPTKITESPAVKPKSDLALTENTILIDARPSFEFEMAHLPGAINMTWQDFAKTKEHQRGLLEDDLFFHARRLARLGITPDTPVVIVGRGARGGGEEGRLAWTLKYMGVKNVDFVVIDYFTVAMTRNPTPQRENAPIWKPVLDESLLTDKDEFLKDVTKPKDSTVIIDVRPEDEFLRRRGKFGKNAVEVGAININWKEFFTSKGRPNAEIVNQLKAVGITPDKKIVLISDQGVESAAVTMALRALGYNNASNYAGGYAELMR